MADQFNESTVEEAALSWFEELGYAAAHGPVIVPGEAGAERESFGDVLLAKRLRGLIAVDYRLDAIIKAGAPVVVRRRATRPRGFHLVPLNPPPSPTIRITISDLLT
jgi:type I restriction enzyme R subunit